MMLIFKKKY